MASSLEMMGMLRSAQAGMAIGDAYKNKVNAQMQSAAIQSQMEEIDLRADMAVKDIENQGKKVVAAQEGAFIKAGVKLEGSAMEVVSDTLADAAEAAMIARRQADYDQIGLARQKASLDSQSSDINFILNSAAGAGGAYASYLGDKRASYAGSKSNNTRNVKGVQ